MRQPPGAESCVPATCQRFASSRVAGAVTRRAPRENVIVDAAHAAPAEGAGCRGSSPSRSSGRAGWAPPRRRRAGRRRARSRARCPTIGRGDGGELRPAGGSAREQERRGRRACRPPPIASARSSRMRRSQAAQRRAARAARGRRSRPTGASLADERPAVRRREQGVETRDLASGAVEPGDDDHGHAGRGQPAEAGERLAARRGARAPGRTSASTIRPPTQRQPARMCAVIASQRERAERRGVAARGLGCGDGHEQREREPAPPRRERDQRRRRSPARARASRDPRPCGASASRSGTCDDLSASATMPASSSAGRATSAKRVMRDAHRRGQAAREQRADGDQERERDRGRTGARRSP